MSQTHRKLVQLHQNDALDGSDTISILLHGTRNFVDLPEARELWRQLGLALSEARPSDAQHKEQAAVALLPSAQVRASGTESAKVEAANDKTNTGVERLGGNLHAQSQALQRHLGIASGRGFVGLDEKKGTWMVWILDGREQPTTTQWAGRPIRYVNTGRHLHASHA